MGIYKLWKVKQKAQKAVDKFHFVVDNIRRERSGQTRLYRKSEKIKSWLSVIYPPWKRKLGDGCYDQMFRKGSKANSIAVLFRNISMIEFFGLVMYMLISFKYSQFPEIIGTSISIVIHVFLMFIMIFPSLMSYFIISIHEMLTTKVKSILVVLIVTMAFEGPAMNIIQNIHQVASGVACVQVDVMGSQRDVEGNIMDKGEVLVARFRAVLKNVAGPMNKVKSMLATLDQKASKFVDVIRRQYRVLADLSKQCKMALQTPYLKCVELFQNGHEFCLSKAKFFGSSGSSCDIITKTAMICNQAQGFGDEVCSFPSIVAKGVKGVAVPFYAGYFNAIEFAVKKIFYVHIEASKWAFDKVKPAIDELKKARKIKAEYQSTDDGKPNAADDTTTNLRKSIRKNLMDIVNFYVRIINGISFVLRFGVMPALLIWPFIYTIRFIYCYNYNDDYKNKFLTEEFKKIDQDCAFRNVRKALPLTDSEAKEYIWRDQWKMTSSEKPFYRLDVFITIISCFTPFCICFLDIGIYKTLYSVHEVMNRTDIQTPSHYELKVAGNGSMAEIMNEFLDVFSPFSENIRERENRWRKCFKEPDPPNYVELYVMVGMLVTALFLCRLKAYLGRQGLGLADHFYSNRVRIRALSLYNKILQGRKNLLAEMLGIAKTDVYGTEDVIMRRSLQSRGQMCADCSKCGLYDMRVSDQENVRVCVHCGEFYCISCFCTTLICLKCDEEMQTINDIELYHEDEDEEDDISLSNSSEDDEEDEKDENEEKISENVEKIDNK